MSGLKSPDYISTQFVNPYIGLFVRLMGDNSHYSSRLTTLLTMIGVAVGLGNVWRFPYMMGSYGGSAFLAVYLAFTILFAYPALMAEMALGRLSGKGTLDALRIVFGKPTGSIVGYFLLAVVTIAGSYYAIVVANVLYTTAFSALFGFSSTYVESYRSGFSNVVLQYSITLSLIFLCLYVIHKGIVRGIEWVSKFIMPFFVLAVAYMIVHALTLPGAIDKVVVFLSPEWGKMTATEVFAALGQAFFSVGLGGTFVVVYAGYIKTNESIPTLALFTGLGDVGASLLVSVFLIPSMLVFGLDMASGPGLIFETFPKLFNTMPGGRFVGTLFLLALSLVAFLSLIAAYQVTFVSMSNEKPSVRPLRILFIIGLIQAVLALPSSIDPSLIGTLDLVFGSGMQVLGSSLCIIGLSWGLTRSHFIDEIFGGEGSIGKSRLAYWWIKWVIPFALIVVLIGYIYESL